MKYGKWQYDYNELRSRISIIELAEAYGYELRPGEGKRCPVYEHPSGDKIIILNPQNSQNQGYFSAHDDRDKGILMSFVANKVGKGIITNPCPGATEAEVVNTVLHNYLNIPVEQREERKAENEKIFAHIEEHEIKDFNGLFGPLKNKQFLFGRGFGSAMFDPIFKGRVLNNDEEHGVPGANKYNIVFPLYGKEGEIIGAEERNKEYKRMLPGSDKANGVWYSNVPDRIEGVFVAESPLDCIAHHQLTESKNVMYFAHSGNLSAGQIETINSVLSKNRDKVDRQNFKFMLGADNDSAGAAYDLQFIRMQVNRTSKCFLERVDAVDKMQADNLTIKDKDLFKTLANSVKKEIDSSIDNDGVSIKIDEEKQEIRFERQAGNYFGESRLSDLLLKTNILPFTKKEKSIMKDWNDDVLLLKRVNEKRETKIGYDDLRKEKGQFKEEKISYEKDRMIEKKEEKKKEAGKKIKM